MNLEVELLNRNKCRHGLVGVLVSVGDSGPVLEVAYSGWQKDSTLLVYVRPTGNPNPGGGAPFPAKSLTLRSTWPAPCCKPGVRNRWNRARRVREIGAAS